MRTLVALFVLAIGVGAAFGQGTVNFNNVVFANKGAGDGSTNPLTGPDRLVYADAAHTIPLKGTQYRAELYYQDGTSFTPVLASLSSFRSTSTQLAGTWNGKSPVLLPVGGVGVPVTLQVRIWDGTTFATYEEALAGGVLTGLSQPFVYVEQLSSPPAPTDTFMWGFRGFTCLSCPEPSAVALGVLGIAGLWLIRRRKQSPKPN